jgi:DNA-binding Lrp family transcriptional regulator
MKEEQLFKVLRELMKNARQSDRAIAEKLNVSQPTVTRARTTLEKGYINGYTAIPSFPKIGYELIAITLVKVKKSLPLKEQQEVMDKGRKWAQENPNVVFAAICSGMGMNGLMMSFHRNYGEYVEFMKKYRSEWTDIIAFQESVMIHMSDDQLVKPLVFAGLIEGQKGKS